MKNCQDLRIIFFGTSEFSAIILEKLIKADMKPVLVVTQPDKPVGRKQLLTASLIKLAAQKYSIPLLQPKKIQDTLRLHSGQARYPSNSLLSKRVEALESRASKIRDTNPDLIVLAAYGSIIPREILDIPKYGALNVHPSLLPKYRGPSPVQCTILNGEEETGVTIMLMDEQIDHGPILANTRCKIRDTRYAYEELHNKLAQIGAELLIETIPQWIEGKIKPMPQDEAKATYTKRLTREDGRIDWKNSAEYIERQVRAFLPWPSAYANFKMKNEKVKTMKILKADIQKQNSEEESRQTGETFLTAGGKFAVQTGKDILVIEELQLEGGKRMPAREFLLGHKNFVGTILQ